MSTFTIRVNLEDLFIDPALLYDGKQRMPKFTYVQRILTLNKSAVMMLHRLEQFRLDAKEPVLEITGETKEALREALETVQCMLAGPLWVSPQPEDPKLLELLEVKKKRFSTVSGCWLNLDTAANIVAFYGINRPVALEFIDRMRTELETQQAQEQKMARAQFAAHQQSFTPAFDPVLKPEAGMSSPSQDQAVLDIVNQVLNTNTSCNVDLLVAMLRAMARTHVDPLHVAEFLEVGRDLRLLF